MELSSLVTDKLPGVRQDLIIKEKIYPSQLDLSDALKEEIETPEVIGKVIQ